MCLNRSLSKEHWVIRKAVLHFDEPQYAKNSHSLLD